MDRKHIKELEKRAYEMRLDVMHMGPRSGNVPHIAPSFSCAEIISALYFNTLNIDPKNPDWEERDRFIMSKGHGCLVQYSALARRGFFDMDELWKVKSIGSILQGHPDMQKTPGIDATSGSLGNGFSFAVGIADALKYKNSDANVYCLVGDGDSQEGIVWEGALFAGNRKLDNLVAILDYNHMQSGGSVDKIMSIEPVANKWESYGWKVLETNGHKVEDIVDALEVASRYRGKPVMVIAHTTKGRGVSYMENNNSWHARMPNTEEYAQGIMELEACIAQIERET